MNLIEIRPPFSLEEYHQACALMEEVYYEGGITTRRDARHPKAILVAVREGTVLGSVGFRAGDQGTLPVEHYFGFDLAEACSVPRATVCEIVKLAAKRRAEHSVFRGLIAACTHYLFVEQSFGLALAIVKPTLEMALSHFLHIPTGELPCPVVRERAAADYPRYFFEGLAPRPITFHRADREVYLDRLLAELEGKATIRSRKFDHRRDYSVAASYPQGAATMEAA